MTDVLRPLSTKEFVLLARESGIDVTSHDLEQLQRRRLMTPNEDGNYSRLHLYVLAVYHDSIEVHRHPWSMRPSKRTMEEVKTAAAAAADLGSGTADPATLRELASAMRAFLDEVDPFGPLGPVVALMRAEALEEFRGAGRLHAEIGLAAAAVEALADDEVAAPPAVKSEAVEPTREMRPVTAADLGANDVETSDAVDDEATPPAVAEPNAPEESEDSEPDDDADGVESEEEAEEERAAVEDDAASEDLAVEESDPVEGLEDLSDPVTQESEGSDLDVEEEEEDYEPVEGEHEENEEDERVDAEIGDDEANEDAEDEGVDDEPSEDLHDEAENDQGDRVSAESNETIVRPAVAAAAASRDGVIGSEDDDRYEATQELEKPSESDPDDDDDDDDIVSDGNGADANGFDREQSSTGRTKALLDRLQEIKAQRKGDDPDEPEAASESKPSPESAAASSEGDSRSLEEKVNELNQLRESLIRDQDWEGLVNLYEDRIDLFEDPADRQQVMLTLATLYELKLGDTAASMQRFDRAFSIPVEEGRRKALDNLRKIGSRPNLAGQWKRWLEEHLDQASGDTLLQMRRDIAAATKAAGDGEGAFREYASFLESIPVERVDTSSLDFLDELSLEVDDDELATFYDSVLSQASKNGAHYLVALRAGTFYLGRNEPHHAVRCFRAAFEADPNSEIAFSNLSRLYEKEENWGDLRSLIARKLASAEGEEAERLKRELGRVVENELSTEEAVAKFGHTLETEYNDEHALTRLVEGYSALDKFADAYAHLNRLLEKPLGSEQAVRVRKHLAQIAAEHLQAPEEAAHHFELALEIAGPDREILEGLASVQMNAGDWSAALSALRTLTGGSIVLGGDRMKKWLNVGIEAARQAERPEDLKHFQDRLAGMNEAP